MSVEVLDKGDLVVAVLEIAAQRVEHDESRALPMWK
jgi:hypothetical protein